MYVEDYASRSSTSDFIPDNQTHDGNFIRGLCNPGFHWYMNSILQQLFYLPNFRQNILTREITAPSSLSEQLLCDLHDIFVDLADSTHTEAVQPSKLFRDFRDSEGNPLDPDEQQDVAFFLDELIRALDLDVSGDTLHSLLSTQYVVQHICPKGHVHEIHQNSLYNPLPIKQSSSLVDSLEDLKYGEYLSDYYCTDCQPQTVYHGKAITRTLFLTKPTVLIFQLLRFTFYSPTHSKKDSSFYTFPDTELLDLTPYLKDIQELEEEGYKNERLYGYIKSKLVSHRIRRRDGDRSSPETILVIDDSDSDSGKQRHSLNAAKQPQVYARVANPVESLRVLTPPILHSSLESNASPSAEPSMQLPLFGQTPQHINKDRTESMYHLHGVICHRGSLKTGHFISFVRQQDSSGWICFDDCKVTDTHSDCLPDDVFGWNPEISTIKPRRRMETRSSPKVPSSYRTAYLLIYLPGVLRINIQSHADGTAKCEKDSEADDSSPEMEKNSLECEHSEETSPEDETTEQSAVEAECSGGRAEEALIGDPVLTDSPQMASLENWLRGWLTRRQIKLKVFSGEAGAADLSIRKQWLETTFESLLKRYNPADIWNADECGLFYTQISKSTYCQSTDKPLGGKVEKHRLSLMLATSMTGQKRRPLIIHRGRSLLAVNTKRNRPYDYQSQPKCWMTLQIFRHWLETWNRELKTQDRYIALVVDGCKVHQATEKYSNISLFFLPPCQTSIMQPLDQGIIRSFKANYRASLLRTKITVISEKKDISLRLPSYVRLICQSWREVSAQTIMNCYQNAGWMIPSTATMSAKQLVMKASEKSSAAQRSEKPPHEEITTEERKAVAELQQGVMASETTTDGATICLPPDDIQIELDAENAQSFEDYSVGEREAVLQVLGLEIPSKDCLQREDLQHDSSFNSDTASHELMELFKFVRRMPQGERKEMRLAVLGSLKQEIQKACVSTQSDSQQAEKPLVQTILHITTKQKS